jgi:uncharacterized protein DUF177 involved in 23S rRNA accumulation
MQGELAWEHAVDDIPAAGSAFERSATAAECEAIARALDLPGCRSLLVRYALVPRGSGHVHLSGSLQAQVDQTCVVTLEPLLNDVAASFKVDYWPETEMPEPSGGAVDMQDDADLEPIVAGRIEVGRVVFESLAGAIDLFPRKPGVSFEAPEEDGSATRADSPFAALAKFKNKQ